jgi:hypothetical protein
MMLSLMTKNNLINKLFVGKRERNLSVNWDTIPTFLWEPEEIHDKLQEKLLVSWSGFEPVTL